MIIRYQSGREHLSDGTRFKYDANGNTAKLIKGNETTTYIYDPQNRLIAVDSQTTGNVSATRIAQYAYDGDGGRIKKTVYRRDKAVYNVNTGTTLFETLGAPPKPATAANPTTETTKYVGQLYEERSSGASSGNGVIASAAKQSTKFIYLGSTRVASVSGQDVMYYHTDHLGGTNALTDKAGLPRELTEYDPFGSIIKHEKYGDDFGTAWYYFTGKPLDDETGLMYYGARYYNPSLGRFITPDTIVPGAANPQNLNRYAYCLNNPVNRVDPDGHKSWWSKMWKTIVTVAVGIVIGVATAGIGTAFYTASLGVFWGGVASAATSGFIAGAVSGGLGAGLNGQSVLQGAMMGGAFGALSGAAFGAIGKVGGKDWNWKVGLERVGLSAVAGGGISEIAGGSFADGAMFAGAIAGADFAYRAIVNTDPRGTNRGSTMKTSKEGGAPKIDVDLRVDGRSSQLNNPDKYSNVGLFSKAGDSGLINTVAGETGPVMSTLGRFVPGFQGLSLAHDITGSFLSNTFGSTANSLAFNFQTMPVIYGINAMGSLINDSAGMIGYYESSRNR